MTTIDGLYWDYHWPLSLKHLIDAHIKRHSASPNTPALTEIPASREWFSQPRAVSDATTEVVSINFKLPFSLSEITFEALRRSMRVEVWYQDRLNNWRPALDKNRIPISITISPSAQSNWYKHHATLYPIVARSVQIRCTRVPSPQVDSTPYVVGIRNTLLRRNVYDRNDGRMPFEDELDPIGNVVSKYIRDWDSTRAIDDKPLTYWKSAPQPDPMAVVSLYLDLRDAAGDPQFVSALAIDPVYTNQTLNVYYSNDETVGTRKLSPITLVSDTDTNTDWRAGRGRWSTANSSEYTLPFKIGPLIGESLWFGIEWTPDFNAEDAPASNPVLLQVTPDAPEDDQFWPEIIYDSGAGQITLLLTDGTVDKKYSVEISPTVVSGESLRIVIGWKYDPDTLYISVKNQSGNDVGHLVDTSPDLPRQITVDGTISMKDFRGLLTRHLIKLEDYAVGAAAFQANPGVYVAPDPVIPDDQGRIPSTTLDNAVYAADWTIQEHGNGGTDDTFYTHKTWTPIWRDYLTYKGRLYFPQSISMKYVKLEFTGLTEEPYPVYDSGIKTTYNTYPIEVQQLAIQKHPGLLGIGAGLLQLGGQVALGAVGIGNVNWLNPQSVRNAVDTIFGQTVMPITVTTGAPITYSELPASPTSTTIDSYRVETANPWVYKRDSLDPQRLAGYTLSGLIADQIQTVRYTHNAVSDALADAFTPLVNFVKNPTAVPVQGQDWWLFPGGGLALPSVIMNGLTAATQVILGRKPTTETRLRFTTESIHRYDTKTVTRDAALAYFAGIREVRALSTTYIDEQDPPTFDFSSYEPLQWAQSNIKQLDTGPITTGGSVYRIENHAFDAPVYSSGTTGPLMPHWEYDPEQWSRDATRGRWKWGSATVEANGTEQPIRSTDPIDVTPEKPIEISCWAWWEDVVANNNEDGLVLGVTTYQDGVPIADVPVDTIVFSDWSAHASSDGEWVRMTGTWNPPAGIDQARIRAWTTEDATDGRFWIDTVTVADADDTLATAYREFITTSTFSRVDCRFSDSGLVRSDAMWARADPLATNIDNLVLAYYVTFIPDPEYISGMWSSDITTWADEITTWGSEQSLVAINVDANRIFDGRRVLRIARAEGAGEAGIKITQQTNFVADALARLCVVFYKPRNNNNSITLRLRRLSDGVYVHEETVNEPPVGYWYTHQGEFFEVPDDAEGDQVYTLEITTVGDAEDELFINDAYTDLALIRYFARLGGVGAFMHDITPLRYSDAGIAQVSATEPVNEFSVTTTILSPKAYAYSCSLAPLYLK